MNLCVLASGKGSNLKYLFKAQKSNKIKSKIKLVISNNSKSGALKFARLKKIPAVHLSEFICLSKDEFFQKMLHELKKYRIDLIILAGYMKLLPSKIIKSYRHRILNVHPALIPSFCGTGMYGIKVHNEVLRYGCKVSGATVHLVDEQYDHGSIVLQKCIAIRDDETPEVLRSRILKLENKLLLNTIRLFESKKFNINGRKVYFT